MENDKISQEESEKLAKNIMGLNLKIKRTNSLTILKKDNLNNNKLQNAPIRSKS